MSAVKKAIIGLYDGIAMMSPYMEVFLRRLYWKNVGRLHRFSPYGHGRDSVGPYTGQKQDFDEVIARLKDRGVGLGSLLLVHSSFDGMASAGLGPADIIDKLLNLIGPSGTLAMPAIRRYREDAAIKDPLSDDFPVCKYNVRKTVITSGLLPLEMVQRPESYVSCHPLNPLVAIGPLAHEMMVHNLDGETPSPHGPNSCWKFCHDHAAVIVWLGVDSDHYNTMVHVAEEAFGDWRWSDDEWYNQRRFILIDDQHNQREITVRERKPKWGKLHIAEMHLNRDIRKNHIIRKEVAGGIVVDTARAQDVVAFLRSKNKRGYPYFSLK